MRKLHYRLLVGLLLISSCSMFRPVNHGAQQSALDYSRKTPATVAHSARYDVVLSDSVVSADNPELNAAWQNYDWHNDAEMRRLQYIADSLTALGESVPDEVTRKLQGKGEEEVPLICNEMIDFARQYLGSRYKHATAGPKTFDCSGFTSFVYGHFGYKLSRASVAQFDYGEPIEDPCDLRRGDLVFWTGSNAQRRVVGHVGIVTDVNHETGEFRFIHAPHTGVQYDNSTQDYYARRYMGARRLIKDED